MARKRFTPNTRFALLLVCLLMISWSGFVASSTPIKAAPGDTIVYVNQAAAGANNGTSWQNAYTDLQAALAAAQPNHSIWIAQGIYRPTSDLSDLAVARTISFEIPNGVELYGGFVGNEAELAERDWDLNKTILSGDLQNNDLTVGGVITTTTAIVGANTRNILKISDADQSTVLDGLIITGGQTQDSDGDPYRNGAGIHIQQASPTLRNLIFSGNHARYGGAIANYNNSSPSISNASFSGNHATWLGGALYIADNSNPSINTTIFSSNSGDAGGGAIANYNNSNPEINNTFFFGNRTQLGGAMYNHESSPSISNASFSANSATFGGAIYNHESSPTISNTTFSGNSGGSGGAINNYSNSNTLLSNSIIWGNSSSILLTNNSSITITYSLVEGCDPAGTWATDCGNDDGGNLSPVDPLFVNPISHTSAPSTTGDLRLLPNSPAINAGNNALNSTTIDLDGKPRIIGSIIDLGAYEALPQLHSFVVGNGTIEYTPLLEHYPLSTTVTITGTANLGWSFAGWSGDLSGSSSPSTLLINDTKQITATFTNDPPTVYAGADQSVLAGTLVTLDGSASFDADPAQTLTYAWTQTAGPDVVLAGANSATPTFTAPDLAATLTFELVVTDNLGASSTADSVTVTVTNGEPIANAGGDQTVLAGSTVTLDGSGSSDPDGHTPLTYAWTQSAGTPVSLTGATTANPTFTAPNTAGVLIFELIVTDNVGLASTPDSVTITVQELPQTIYNVYLPMVRGQEQRPNLVVSALSADQNGIRVVIENRGDAATQAGFWVDVFVNPHQVPSSNTVWQKIAPMGAVWAVKQTLEPGESLTLTQTSPFYVPDYSFGSFEAGAQLYAYVDSYHSNNSYGVELEHNESDNLFGPVAASAAGKMSGPTPSPAGLYQGLPIR